ACAVRLHAWAACQAGQFLVIQTCQPICERPKLVPGACVRWS
ncbi:mCG1037763, partial [Mus musculus]